MQTDANCISFSCQESIATHLLLLARGLPLGLLLRLLCGLGRALRLLPGARPLLISRLLRLWGNRCSGRSGSQEAPL